MRNMSLKNPKCPKCAHLHMHIHLMMIMQVQMRRGGDEGGGSWAAARVVKSSQVKFRQNRHTQKTEHTGRRYRDTVARDTKLWV